MSMYADLSVPVRRPSRMSSPSPLGSSNHLSPPPLGVPQVSSYDAPPRHHRVPLSMRLPSLFRTKIPLIAVLPFFLLGYLFAPIQNFDAEDQVGLKSSTVVHTDADLSQPEIINEASSQRNWAQRLLKSSYSNGKSEGRGLVNSAAAAHLQPRQQYTEQDGLLYFPPAGRSDADEGVDAALLSLPKQQHPILHLIEKAEAEWEDLLNRQSTTLEGAVKEYRRRYKRAPPAGFDRWWAFVQKHDVQLVDEYDTIMRDMEPFYALPPRIFRARVYQLAHEPDFHLSRESFTVNIDKGSLTLAGPHGQQSRARETKELMDGIAQYLPDMEVVLTSHDGPGVFLTGEAKARHLAHAKAGTFMSEAECDDIFDMPEYAGWTGGCPPGSNWRRSLFGNAIQKPSTHSFISDVEESSDVCKHPNIGSQHGFFLWTGPGPDRLYPLFTWAKTSLHSDILVTPLEQYYLEVGPDPKWEDKKHNKLLWRGSNTGAAYHRESRWRSSQRARLVLLAQEKDVTKSVHLADKSGVLKAEVEQQEDLNDRFMDVSFSGHPAQCDEGDGTCAALRKVFDFKGSMSQLEANEYKYIFDMDGNGWSGRFHRLLMSNSAILKSTIMPEWYQQRIMPWVHYIPVKVDYTDLYDILGFFIGGPDGVNNHDQLAKKIAKQGQDWAKYHWREEDMQAYLFRLLLEYGRLLHRTDSDPNSADYVLS